MWVIIWYTRWCSCLKMQSLIKFSKFDEDICLHYMFNLLAWVYMYLDCVCTLDVPTECLVEFSIIQSLYGSNCLNIYWATLDLLFYLVKFFNAERNIDNDDLVKRFFDEFYPRSWFAWETMVYSEYRLSYIILYLFSYLICGTFIYKTERIRPFTCSIWTLPIPQQFGYLSLYFAMTCWT